MDFRPYHETDMLLGMASPIPKTKKHWLLVDWDDKNIDEILENIGESCFKKRKFGNCYLIKSGKGYHMINFSNPLTLKEYVEILHELDACPKFIEWIEKKVNYGVLRLSRRSSHMQVPKVIAVLKSPYNIKENESARNLYFNFIKLEESIKEVKRVKVYDTPT